MLRNLSGYYAKEPTLLLLVRVAQGLVHMGKGLLGLAPYHTDGQLASGARARASVHRKDLQGLVHMGTGLLGTARFHAKGHLASGACAISASW